ncbi:MAG: hypothetical protein HKN28_06695 [Alphaproteobacteria bacterium]|nr:hypothetical protein [Alphaproteobacteria bacterium]
MKPRHPKKFASAVTKIRSALGDDLCAAAVGRSASLVRKWADPDHSSLPNVEQAVLLDTAYIEHEHKKPPLLDLYTDVMAEYVDADKNQKVRVDILLSTLSVQGIVGDLSEAIREALSPKSEGGRQLTPRERSEILAILERLDDVVDSIEDAVEES